MVELMLFLCSLHFGLTYFMTIISHVWVKWHPLSLSLCYSNVLYFKGEFVLEKRYREPYQLTLNMFISLSNTY